MVGTDPDALAAVNAEFLIDTGLFAPHADSLCGAPLDAGDAAPAQGRIQPYGMIKFVHWLLPPTGLRP